MESDKSTENKSEIIDTQKDLSLNCTKDAEGLPEQSQQTNLEVVEITDTSSTEANQSDLNNSEIPEITHTQKDLPSQLCSVAHASCTDTGRLREHNEDCFGVYTTYSENESNTHDKNVEARGLYIICDGMGGHTAGELASAEAVKTVKNQLEESWKDEFPDKKTIESAILAANQAIYDINQSKSSSGSGRMGTTLVMMLLQGTRVAIANVGDSRLYRLTHRSELQQLTEDHEVGQLLIKQGADPQKAYESPDAHYLLQALGPADNSKVKPDIEFIELQEDTLFLLCSDGLSDDDFIEKHWEEYLKPLLGDNGNIHNELNKFVQLAVEENGHDNITAILVRAKVNPVLKETTSNAE